MPELSRRVRGGLPNQGIAILYEILNEQDWILAERSYAVWGDLEALMLEPRAAAVHPGLSPPVAAFECWAELRDRARLHQHAERSRSCRHPATRKRAARA